MLLGCVHRADSTPSVSSCNDISASCTARFLKEANFIDGESFFLEIKFKGTFTPGIQLHRMFKIMFDDGTWIYGTVGCFPTGVSVSNKIAVGEVRSLKKIPENRIIKSVQFLGRIGDPNMLFIDPEHQNSFDTIDNQSLIKAGGFVIDIPVREIK